MFGRRDIISQLKARAIEVSKASKRIIVYPEIDETIIKACSIIKKKGIACPMILGPEPQILDLARSLGIKNLDTENVFDYQSEKNKAEFDDFIKIYFEQRKKDGKDITMEDAKAKMGQPHYYGAMMVNTGLANGMISGINIATKPYFPAFEIIKTKEGVSRVSGLFIMIDHKKTYFFADCALNINPTAAILAEIALTTVDTVVNFGIRPRVAMLSFSTRDSAKHEMIDKVKNATQMVRQKDSDIIIDGEMQLDAAIVPEVARKKCPGSVLEGKANVLIFPDLNSGNIGYKLVQRFADYKAIGPIMQGLSKPINDLSRGCSVDDVVDLTAITVIQGL